MQKNYFTLLLFVICLLAAPKAFAQVEYRYVSGFGNAFWDVNDSGKAVQSGGVYDFASSTVTPIDTNSTGLLGINNSGDLIGMMPFTVSGTTIQQPAFKHNNVWTPIGYFTGATVTADASATVYQISENGLYVAGQMAADCCDAQAFLYNTMTGVLEKLADPANEYSAGYTVNNSGMVGGWYDPQPVGTLRTPAYMTTGSVVTNVSPTAPNMGGQVGAISNGNLIVGDRDNQPFIFNQTTGVFTAYQTPAGYDNATFTSVSENGIAVGYAQKFGPFIDREAIVYHASLGSQPVFIKDILAQHGITALGTFDGKLGTAIAISPDGNYICGWENDRVFFASGWVVNFKNMLISDCYATCPQNIEAISLTGPRAVNYTIPITCPTHPNTSLVLVSGLASGAVFPIDTTVVVHNLVDANGTVLNTCTFSVILGDQYCSPHGEFMTAEPITSFSLANITNVSSDTSTVIVENFTAQTINLTQGTSYTATIKGMTGGNFTDYLAVFIDWDKNGVFDPATEKYDMGTITNSTGLDTVQTTGTIAVPLTAMTGRTTLRVIKNYDFTPVDACNIYSSFGQAEDYSVNVTVPLATDFKTQNAVICFPNPTKDLLNIQSIATLQSVTLYNILGQQVLQTTCNGNTTINTGALPSGTYSAVLETTNHERQTVKIVKE
jgi:hypothetical protein